MLVIHQIFSSPLIRQWQQQRETETPGLSDEVAGSAEGLNEADFIKCFVSQGILLGIVHDFPV
jgi:hypothetical protein